MDDSISVKHDKITVCEDTAVYVTAIVQELYDIFYSLADKSSNKITTQTLMDVVNQQHDLRVSFGKAMFLYDKEEAYDCGCLDDDLLAKEGQCVIAGSGKGFLKYLFKYIFDEIIELCISIKDYSAQSRITTGHAKTAVNYLFAGKLFIKLKAKGDEILKSHNDEKAKLPKKSTKKKDDEEDAKPKKATVDDEDAKPKKPKKDDDEEVKPKKPKKDDEEEVKPKKPKKDDEEVKPKKPKVDDEDVKPKKKKEDDDDEEVVKPKKKKRMTTTKKLSNLRKLQLMTMTKYQLRKHLNNH